MMLQPEEFALERRDAKREMELSRYLRGICMNDKWNFVLSALDADRDSNLPNALVIAPRIGLGNEHLVKLLNLSLERADPSSMDSYLKAVIAGLGYRKVVAYFRAKITSHTEQVGMALYFLSYLPLEVNEAQLTNIADLRSEFEAYVKSCGAISPYLQSCLSR